ncbi:MULTISPECIES: winged helix-turn-helix domain-containing protein [unclassified Variovorax]|uniref:winged helix-turn-helix domain-containing protein n=1 Tax=unclassified Variovorax TaxID=663243 RepID=UPI003F44EBE0
MQNQNDLSSSFVGFVETLMRPAAPLHELNASRIAVLDPDLCTRKRMRRAIRRLGYVPVAFTCVKDLLQECLAPEPRFEALVLACLDNLDWGEFLIAQLREFLGIDIPMIVSTSRSHARELSILHGGVADAVIVTPGSLSGTYQLMASCLQDQQMPVAAPLVEWGAYRFDLRLNTAEVAGDEVKLKPIEFDLAVEFFRNMGRPLTRDWLRSVVWEQGRQSNSRSLDMNLSGLRQKLRLRADLHGLELQSIRTRGYQLSVASQAL